MNESYVAMISTNRSSTYIVYEYIPELVTLCHQLGTSSSDFALAKSESYSTLTLPVLNRWIANKRPRSNGSHQLNMNVTNQHPKCEGSNNVGRFFITLYFHFFFDITE